MTTATATGYLSRPAEKAYTPTGRAKLIFDLIIAEVPWRCEIEDPALIEKAEPLLTAGRAVIVQGELAGRPFVERGVTKGFTRYLRINQAEFVRPDRSNKLGAAEEEGAPAV